MIGKVLFCLSSRFWGGVMVALLRQRKRPGRKGYSFIGGEVAVG